MEKSSFFSIRVKGSKVAWVDFDRIRENYLELRNYSSLQIEEWLLANFARVSELRLADFNPADPYVFTELTPGIRSNIFGAESSGKGEEKNRPDAGYI